MSTNVVDSSRILRSNPLERTSSRLDSNTELFNLQIKSKQKPVNRKNDSSQVMKVFSKKQVEQKRSKESCKNVSYIGPSSFSITYLHENQKVNRSGKQMKAPHKSAQYRPYLSEITPEYVGCKEKSVSLQQRKDIHKKYSIKLGNSKPVLTRLKVKRFSPLKLCDENKFSRLWNLKSIQDAQSGRVEGIRHPTATRKSCQTTNVKNKNKLNRKSKKLSPKRKNRFSTCEHENTRNCNINSNAHQVSISDCSCTSLLDGTSHSRVGCFLPRFHKHPPYKTGNSEPEEDLCKNCPCPLHNAVQFRSQNFAETHATPPKESQSQNLATYILDERLFPIMVHTENRTRINDKPMNLVSSSKLDSFVTLKPRDVSNLYRTGKLVSNNSITNPFETLQTSEKAKRAMLSFNHAPTNSLALKNQKGLR